MSELIEPLRDKGIAFSWSDEVPALLAAQAEGGSRGARDLRNTIRRKVEDAIASLIVSRPDRPLTKVSVEAADGEISLAAE